MRRVPRWVWVGGAVGAYGLGVCAWLAYSPSTAPNNDDRVHRFRAIAAQYDESIEQGEARMGMTEHRAALVRQAHGRVLEVGAGTCRNLLHYNKGLQALVLVDAAPEMIAKCREKINALPPSKRALLPADVQTLVAYAEHLPFADGEFDTVIDTFGLCSVTDPKMALREMQRVLKPSSSSRILLLEHGRSPYWPVNVYLDALAHWHARRWGCWWNRPLHDAVHASNFEILDQHRAHMGTTLVVSAAPRSSAPSPSPS